MDSIRFVLECDGDVAGEVEETLRAEADAEVSSASKSNLDGSPETVLQIVQIAVSAAGMVLPLVLPWVRRKNIRKVRFGDIEIENPTQEQVEVLWQQYLADRAR